MNLAIFDIDGTLTLGTSYFDAAYLRAVALEFGFEGLSSRWADYGQATDSGILSRIFRIRLGRQASENEVERFKRRYLELLSAKRATGREVPGAKAALQRLREDGWSLALATGNWREAARMKLEFGGLDLDGVPIGCADDHEDRAEIVRAAILKAGGPFERVVYVGDRPWDLDAARRVGVAFVGVAGGRPEDELRAAGAEHVLPDYADIPRLLVALQSAKAPA